MSSNKNETAVHGCNPAISVLVVLVSHKVYFLCSTISLAVLFVIEQKLADLKQNVGTFLVFLCSAIPLFFQLE